MAKGKSLTKYNLQYWLIIGILNSLRVFTWLPYSWQLKLGRTLGRSLMKNSKSMQRVTKVNLAMCFPELTEQQRDELMTKNFESLGMGFFETLLAAWGSKKLITKLLKQVNGLQQVLDTLESGTGVILLFPHIVHMYLAGRLLMNYSGLEFSLMYHSPKHKALNDFMLSHLQPHVDQVFSRKDFRNMIKHLKLGKIVWYAPDLDLGEKNSIFVPFFNNPAATLVAPSVITKLTKAKLFPIGFYRRDELDGYEITIHPALKDIPSGDELKDLTQVNAAIEKIARVSPKQYLWQYKRFSTQPDGKSPYKKPKHPDSCLAGSDPH